MNIVNSKDLLYQVKGLCIDIHKEYGPGLLEKTYHKILQYKLLEKGYKVDSEVSFNIVLGDKIIEDAYRIDLLVNDCLIIEIKSVVRLEPVHHKQLITYMTFTKKDLGLLVNFGCADIFKEGLKSWDRKAIKKPFIHST